MTKFVKIYMDNCCFNRPFDDQSQLRIRLESEAKLKIQEEVRSENLKLIWSYVLDYENNKNPFAERKEQIAKWKKYAIDDINETVDIIKIANTLMNTGLRKMDSLHIACAIVSQCDYFLSTDDKILKKFDLIEGIKTIDPFVFIKELFL